MNLKRKIISFYEKTKRIILLVMVVITLCVGTIPLLSEIPGLFQSFLIGSMLLFLEMFFSIYEKVLDQKNDGDNLYVGITKVIPEIMKYANSKPRSNSPTTIQILSNSGSIMFPIIRTLILEAISEGKVLNITFELFLMDPDFSAAVIGGDTKNVSTNSLFTVKSINEFVNDSQDKLKDSNVRINYYLYKFTPTIHGFLVDNKILYMSHFHWFSGGLGGAHNLYKKYDDPTDFGLEHIKCFQNWFEYAKSRVNAKKGMPT